MRYDADQVWTGNPLNWTRAVDYTYTPDKLNRSSMNDNGVVSSYTASGLNQYSVNNASYSYDGNFNLASAPNWGGDYDAENRLRSGGHDGGVVFLIYDGLGRCVRRVAYAPNGSSTTVLFTYDGWKPTIEWDGDGNLEAWNAYGSGPDEILWRFQAGIGHLRYHHDAHGNVTFILGAGAEGYERYTYDAFGKPTITDWSGNVRTQSAYGNRFMFQGREFIAELGIYDYRHRMYDPSIGRFLQSDPMGLQTEGAKLTAEQKAIYGAGAPEAFSSSEMNLFRYCGDDPVDKNDPLGLYVPEPRGFDPERTQRIKDEVKKIGEKNGFKEKFKEWEGDKVRRYIDPAKSDDNFKGKRGGWNSFIADIERMSKSWLGGNNRGGTIYYDPDNWKTATGNIRMPMYGLAHEIGHMIDAWNGTYATDGWKAGENRAIWFENQVRPENEQRPYQ